VGDEERYRDEYLVPAALYGAARVAFVFCSPRERRRLCEYVYEVQPAICAVRDGRLPSRLANADYKNFAPRLGVAWSPTP
jgi:hypothetical protein